MKKSLLFIFSSFLSIGSYAQSDSDSNKQSDLKPSKGSIATELNVNPFNGEINLNNSLNQIKVRLFTKDDIAVRFGLNIKNEKHTLDQNQPYGSTPVRIKDEKTSTTLGLNLGLEKHFKGSRRVSPYIGADISIENHSAKHEKINGQATTTLKNIWHNVVTIPTYSQYNSSIIYQTIDTPDNNAYFSYGLNIFTGFDFYIVKNFFFGYEFNLGFTQTNYKKPELIITGPNSNNINNNNYDYDNKSFSVGPRLLNGIRLGYNF